MIHLYKRTILNDCDHFLRWFQEELDSNERFRRVYGVPTVCDNSMQYLMEQWFIVTDFGSGGKKDNEHAAGLEDDEEKPCIVGLDIHNMLEQKFEELLMLLEMQLVLNTRNVNIKNKRKSKK